MIHEPEIGRLLSRGKAGAWGASSETGPVGPFYDPCTLKFCLVQIKTISPRMPTWLWS